MGYHNSIDIMLQENLDIAIKKFGLEGALEKIEVNYKNNSKVKNMFLEFFWKKFKNNT